METAIRTTLVAEASPGLPPISAVNRSNAVVASRRTLPPTIEGVPKSAIDSTNASSAPLLTAGKTSGSVTLKKRRQGPAPRLSAASSTDGLIAPQAACRQQEDERIELQAEHQQDAEHAVDRRQTRCRYPPSSARIQPFEPSIMIHA